MKNGGKYKSVAFIILVSVLLIISICVHFECILFIFEVILMFLSYLLQNIPTDYHKLIHPLKTLTNKRLFHYFTLLGHTGVFCVISGYNQKGISNQ